MQNSFRGVDQVPARLLFGYKSLDTDSLSFFHDLPVLVHGENHDRCLRQNSLDRPGGIESVRDWHGDVQDDQVRL